LILAEHPAIRFLMKPFGFEILLAAVHELAASDLASHRERPV
jgi:hypothetical protein